MIHLAIEHGLAGEQFILWITATLTVAFHHHTGQGGLLDQVELLTLLFLHGILCARGLYRIVKEYEMEQTWRELLGSIIADPQERQRLASALGVNSATIVRWTHDETNPRLQNLNSLVQFVSPQYREQLQKLIVQEFPDFATFGQRIEAEELEGKIPPEFYESVLDAYTQTSKARRFFTVSSSILTKALDQLDPNHLGLALSVAQCISPPPGRKEVHSLREVTGIGTPPWQPNLTREALMLGIESLAGYTVTKGRSLVAERGERLGFLPVRWEEWEESAAAGPIWFEGRIAGCLIASSTQPGYFLPFRQRLVERYAQLLALAFEPDDFFEQNALQLLPMPARDAQRIITRDFQQRLSQLILKASREQKAVDIEQAELLIWQQYEEKLLLVPVQGIETAKDK